MVIGFDGSRAFVPNRTGTENYSYQLLKALAKIDKKNTYIVYIRSRNNKEEWPDNFQFKLINWSRLWTQGGLAKQTFKDKLDVLFVPAHTLPLIKKPGLKTVVTVHDLGSEYLPSMHQLKQRLYLGFMQKFQLKTVTKIIAVSKATKEDLVKKVDIDPKKISVVYEGYDKEKFKVQNSKFKIDQTIKKYNLMYQNYFLFVGTVQPRKNLKSLILAFNRYISSSNLDNRQDLGFMNNDLRFKNDEIKNHQSSIINHQLLQLIIAGSKGWLSEEIYALPKKLGIEERVKFLGHVPDEDLPALYSGAIALTFPSLFEGFGLPILEAQACGCPVLTSNVSSLPEVAGKGAVFVNPENIEEIVEGMRKVQSSRYKVQSVKVGFENVKRFSWDKCARETLEVLVKD
ncbi:glycosyltransferase family 4 protein [Patescibacteria group bacterium]|nr:glycosyltransferase family 4 protein [Patescibacteria group bacterium]